MGERYANIIRAILARPWAIDPDSIAWAAICDVLALRASGGVLTDEEITARIEAAQNGPRNGSQRTGKGATVAVLPLYGIISPRVATMSRMSGGTAADAIAADFRSALADPEVDGIVFDVDSPGGNVEGIAELADAVREARGQKPIAAVANHMAASAAYWAISGVDEIVVTPSGSLGSIGVFAAHQDVSAAQEKLGVKTTLVSAGKYKVEGNQFEPLGDEARASIQADVDAFYSMFVHGVAKGRRVSVEAVRGGFGEGRVVLGKAAVEQGLADRTGTLEDTIRRVARGAVGTPPKATALSRTTVEDEPDERSVAALGSGLPFAERLALVSGEAEALAEHARSRATLRAEEGRDLSDATREGLIALSDSLRSIAADPAADTPAEPIVPSGRRRVDLEVLEVATRGGYRLPEPTQS